MGTKNKKAGPLDLKEKRDSSSRRPCEKHCNRGLEAPVHCKVTRLRFQPRAGKKSLSWESVVLTFHCRELVLLANLQQKKVKDT
jgi:hypothetical protein